MKMKKQAMVLSAALSIASLTGSVASCVAGQPTRHDPVEEPVGFCYQTLGEITCYSAPQPQMGPVVALPPEPSQKVDTVPANTGVPKPDNTPVNTPESTGQTMPPSAPITNNPPNNTPNGEKPISIKPEA